MIIKILKLLLNLFNATPPRPHTPPSPNTPPPSPPPSPKPPSTPKPSTAHIIDFADTKIIREFEGFSLKAYPDPATGGEPWTISYGLTGAWVKKDTVLTADEANRLFMEYIKRFCNDINKLIKVPVTKNQYIALLSLTWNIGVGAFSSSTLLRLLNDGDYEGAASQFLRWNRANGKVMNGLIRRRQAEKELFLCIGS